MAGAIDDRRGGWRPVPGPSDRVGFAEAQRRNRRKARRLTGVYVMMLLLLSVPLSIAISPQIVMGTAIVFDLVNLVTPAPDLLKILASVGNGSAGDIVAQVALVVALLLVPGALVLLLSWLGVRRLFRSAGAGAALLSLGARPPRAGDVEEEQLVNVVAEIALAAGASPPEVRLLDWPEPNAAVIGASTDKATIVVTRGLLDDLGRAETQGAIAQLVASVGNGDLRIAMNTAAVYQALGLVTVLLDSPWDGGARAAHLFIFGPEATKYPGRRAGQGGWSGSRSGDPKATPMQTFGAPIEGRLDRLAAMGSDVAVQHKARLRAGKKAVVVLILSPLLLLVGAVMVAAVVVTFGVGLALNALFAGFVFGPLHALLRYLGT